LLGPGAGIDAAGARLVPRRHRRPASAQAERGIYLLARSLVEVVIPARSAFAPAAPTAFPAAFGRARFRGGQCGQPGGELLGDLLHEARRRVEAQFSEQRPAARERERQLLAGARHAHVAEPPLLGHLLRILDSLATRTDLAKRARAGKDALLEARHPYRVELQPLRGMQGHERDALASFGRIGIADQGEPLEEPEQRTRGTVLYDLRD